MKEDVGRLLLGPPTAGRNAVEILAAVFGPLLCFLVDLGILVNRGRDGQALLGFAQGAVYAMYLLTIIALMAAMASPCTSGRLQAVASGTLRLGGVVALAIAIVLLPWTLVGTLFLVGALGWIPLVCGAVCIRWSLLAAHSAKAHLGIRRYRLGALAGIGLGILAAGVGRVLLQLNL